MNLQLTNDFETVQGILIKNKVYKSYSIASIIYLVPLHDDISVVTYKLVYLIGLIVEMKVDIVLWKFRIT